jgi:hypothetical protein
MSPDVAPEPTSLARRTRLLGQDTLDDSQENRFRMGN